MLLDHSDPPGHGIGGCMKTDLFSFDENLSVRRSFQPIEYFHDRGLAGSILPNQAEDLPLIQMNGNVIVRQQRTVKLVDMPHFKDFFAHGTPFLRKLAVSSW